MARERNRIQSLESGYLNDKLKRVDAQRAHVIMEKYAQMKKLEKLKIELNKEREEKKEDLSNFQADIYKERQANQQNFALNIAYRQNKRAEDLAALNKELVYYLLQYFFV